MELHLENRSQLGVQDAVLLEDYTNEKVFIDNLQKRFKENHIYTYIGQVLISINPYKELNIYTEKQMKIYSGKHFYEVPCHVFAIAETAYRSIRNEHIEQCILISGESGSGKTEASKKVLQYVAQVDNKVDVRGVKDKLLLSNPLLEAFGNAKTNRNDNSSRFGKYMDILFSSDGTPSGGNVQSYLLEKSRIIHQATGERNFHIFYQFLLGSSNDQLEEYHLSNNLNLYNYLTGGTKDVSNSMDRDNFKHIKNALKTLGVTDEKQKEIFSILAAILNLGNLTFTDIGGYAEINYNKNDLLKIVANLFSCDLEELKDSLTYRTVQTVHDAVRTPLDKDLANYARDALAKAVYDRLFSWLVQFINDSLQPENHASNIAMGILDIYGFEVFEKNGFEQLCINFCNEKLQQLFIELTLKSEQLEYETEGIEWVKIDYFDNKIICDLIEEKHKGIIAYMDEECLRPGNSTDLTLLQKLDNVLDRHNHYLSHRKADIQLQKIMGRDEFKLIHYAGAVTYNVKGFIEKNNDLLFRDLKETMSNSKNDILREVFPKSELTSKKMPDTAITKFGNSLNNLLASLIKKQPSYIRCIKPNDSKKPGLFDEQLVKHQVQYLGLMENLRVRRAGFAYRRTYELFLERYKCLSTKTWPNYRGPAKNGVHELVQSLGLTPEEHQMGRTKIFIRYPKTLFETEDAFQEKKNYIATIIQSKYKGILQRRKYLRMRDYAIIMQKYIRRFLAKLRLQRRKKAAIVLTKFVKGFLTRNGPVTDINKKFVETAKKNWLLRLSKSLPKSVLYKSWPPCPHSCIEASDHLHKLHRAHLSRVYRLALDPNRKQQFELKVLAERLFKDKKKSYKDSFPDWFKTNRVDEPEMALKKNYLSTLNGEKEIYSSSVTKYDRHGYKIRERVIIVTQTNLHLIELKGSAKLKHSLSLKLLKLTVTSENDNLLLVKIPDNLIKKEKGDLILLVPHLIEAVTHIVNATKDEKMLTIINAKTIEHAMVGKQGTIDISIGNPGKPLQRSKSGHLLIMASP